MITVCQATPAHVACMQRRVEAVMSADQLTHALTILSEAEPLCCWGVSTLWPGVGLAWVLERQPLAGHPYAHRIGRTIVRTWRQWQADFRYVEALVVADRADSRRLVECCGFVCTAVKEGYGPGGETMLEYTWRADDGC